jgi:hypothetical protein
VTLTAPSRGAKEAKPQQGPLQRRGDRRLVGVDAQLQAPLDKPRDARHDALPRAFAADIDSSVVGVAHEAVPAPLELPVEVVEHDVAEQRRERRALRGPLLRRLHQPAGHDAHFQVGPDQLEHPLVMHPSGNPGHQGVVLNSIEERVQIKIDAPHRAICDEAACPLDRLVGRAPRPVAEA